MRYRKKDNVRLAYDANKLRLRLEARLLLDRMLNEALAEMDEQFSEAVNRGELLDIAGSREELRRFMRDAAERELGPSGGPARALNQKK